jgi:hypothetical protein
MIEQAARVQFFELLLQLPALLLLLLPSTTATSTVITAES